MIRTRLTELVGCTAPIQQAPMGTVSSPSLAVAVAEAGGIGSFNTLGITREALREQLDGMSERTDGVLAVSFLTNDIDADAVVDAASRVRIVDFFWSDPRPDLVDVAHRGGALVNWQVGSVGEARAAVQAGADMVSAQGVEAGGHCRGDTPMLPLLCEVWR
jgi:nitronate monooxygenase